MQVLITRPREDADRLVAEMTTRGVEVLVEPLMTIVPRTDAPLDLVGVQAILLTSGNGARALAATTDRRDLRVLAVGDATATAARTAGFTQVESADGNVDDLARMTIVQLEPKDGALIHVAGRDVTGDLAGRLTQAGFAVRRVPLYEAEAAKALSEEARVALDGGAIDAVLLFSPRTAETFVALVNAAGLAQRVRGMTLVCLSPAVATASGALAWRQVVTALEPTQAELLAAFDRWRSGDPDAAAAIEVTPIELRPGGSEGRGGSEAMGASADAGRGRGPDGGGAATRPVIDVDPVAPGGASSPATGGGNRTWRIVVTAALLVLLGGIVAIALRPWWPPALTALLAPAPPPASAPKPSAPAPAAAPPRPRRRRRQADRHPETRTSRRCAPLWHVPSSVRRSRSGARPRSRCGSARSTARSRHSSPLRAGPPRLPKRRTTDWRR